VSALRDTSCSVGSAKVYQLFLLKRTVVSTVPESNEDLMRQTSPLAGSLWAGVVFQGWGMKGLFLPQYAGMKQELKCSKTSREPPSLQGQT